MVEPNLVESTGFTRLIQRTRIPRYILSGVVAALVVAFVLKTSQQLAVRPNGSRLMEYVRPMPSLLTAVGALAAARLLGLLGWAGRGVQAWWRQRRATMTAAVAPVSVVDPLSWESLSLATDGALAVLSTALVVTIRWMVATALEVSDIPFGSDWEAFATSAYAWDIKDWNLWVLDKWPGYPVAISWMRALTGLSYVDAAVWVSRVSMTLSAPALYLLTRLTLGRRVAVGTCLLFAIPGLTNIYANAATVYGLFTFFTVLQVAAVVVAWKSARLWAWLAAGLTFAVGGLVEVKVLTVAAPMAVVLLWALARAERSWSWRVAAVALVAAPGLGAAWLLRQMPMRLTPLAFKLKVNAAEFLMRFRSATPLGNESQIGINDAPDHLPDMWTRIHYNSWWMRQDLAPDYWWVIVGLIAVGALAPLITRGAGPLRARLWAMQGASVHLLALASAAGAMTLYYMDKYIIHVAPFAAALAVNGAWAAASWLAPVTAVVSRSLMAWILIGLMATVSIGNRIEDPMMRLGGRDTKLLLRSTVWRQGPSDLFLLADVSSWAHARGLEQQITGWCVTPTPRPYVLYFPRLPRYLDPHFGRNPREMLQGCKAELDGPTQPGRVWLVEGALDKSLVARFTGAPERFRPVYTAEAEQFRNPRPSFTLYEEIESRSTALEEVAPTPAPPAVATPHSSK